MLSSPTGEGRLGQALIQQDGVQEDWDEQWEREAKPWQVRIVCGARKGWWKMLWVPRGGGRRRGNGLCHLA